MKTGITQQGADISLLIDADGQPIKTLRAWKQQRIELRSRWTKFLGPMPEKRPPVELKVLREDRIDGCGV